MSSLIFCCITHSCVHEERSKNAQNNVLAYTKTRLSFASEGNLQNLRENVYVMWRNA